MPALFFINLWLCILNNSGDLFPLVVFFVVFYCLTVVKAMFLFGVFSLYSIYLYTSAFFVYSRFIFDLFDFASFLRIRFPVSYTFDNSVGMIFISIIFLSHYIIDIIYTRCFYSKKEIEFRSSDNELFKHYPQIQSCGICVMFISFPAIMYKLYLQMAFVQAHGYLSVFNGELAKMPLPFWTSGSGTLFLIGYIMVLFSYPSKRTFVFSSIIFLFYSLTGSLRGSRSQFLTEVIATLYFYIKFYRKKVSLKTVLLLFAFVVIFSIAVSNYTRGKSELTSTSALLREFFYAQGHTIGVPLTIIESQSEIVYRRFPFILTELLDPFFKIMYPTSGQTRVILEKYNMIGAVVIYKLSPRAYYNGNGLGASIIAEMYDFGGFIGIILWSIIFGLMTYNIDNHFGNKNVNIPLLWFVVKTIIYSPRGDFFFFVRGALPIIIIVAFWLYLNIYPQRAIRNQEGVYVSKWHMRGGYKT
jgi:oligosaccharide repeat unit polymerase